MTAPGPVLETERLILRPTASEDVEGFAALAADPEASRHIGGRQPYLGAWRQCMTMAGAWALTGVAMFSVIEAQSGRWIGRVGPWRPAGWPAAEVGWGLLREAWGKGYAFEAAVAAIDYAFDVLGWDQVTHMIAPENHPSARLAERLGSRPGERGFVLPEPAHEVEIVIWRQTAREWRARRARLTSTAT